MIKFILAVIAMIFVGLAAYVYMNPKETHTPVAKVAQKTEKSIVMKETTSVQKESVSAKSEVLFVKKSSVKNAAVKSPQVASQEITQEIVDEKGLTLEDSDLSDEERIDRAIINELNTPKVREDLPSEEEIRQVIFEDNKN